MAYATVQGRRSYGKSHVRLTDDALIPAGRAPSLNLFRVSRHAGIWCVIRNGVFVSDYETEAQATEAAQAAARQAEALGHQAQVIASPDSATKVEPRGE